jgi:TM2 domain-containing membrane protein YozV
MKQATLHILSFYLEGFRRMRLGRTLWAIILIKLVVLFGVFKLFFFQDYLDTRFSTDEEKASYVFENITNPPAQRRFSW